MIAAVQVSMVDTLPIWGVGIIIFLLRVVDVSIGTVRTIFVVEGRATLAIVLGFFEVLVWVTAIAQVVGRFDDSPWLAPFYAGGFAAGIGVGLLIERQLALKLYVIRILSTAHGREIAEALRGQGHVLATFSGETNRGPVNLIYLSARGKRLRDVLDLARGIDPDLFYLVESARQWSENVHPLPHPTGWRAVFKKK